MEFEVKYEMSTESFYKKCIGGKLEENMGFMEWRACRQILNNLLEEKRLLEEISN